MTVPLVASQLPLPLVRRGKVREVYEVDSDTLLLVASDRVSAFDVVLREPVAHKGAVLTQLSAFWFRRLAAVMPSHFLSADADEIVERVPALEPFRAALTGRAMLARRRPSFELRSKWTRAQSINPSFPAGMSRKGRNVPRIAPTSTRWG